MGRKSKAKFELKGHTLPGINQKSETSNLKDGKSPSSAFQMESPMKEVSDYLKGAKIDPMAHKDLSGKIPAFSDFISTDTQSKLWDKFHDKRAKKRTPKEEFIKNNPEVDLKEQLRLANEANARANQGN